MDYKEISTILGLSYKTVYNKYNGKTEYTLGEIIKLQNYYNISFATLINTIRKGETINENIKKNNY